MGAEPMPQARREGFKFRIGLIAFTFFAFLCFAHFIWAFVLVVLTHSPMASGRLGRNAYTVGQVFPAHLSILLLGVFYLWACAHVLRRSVHQEELRGAACSAN